MLSNLNCNLRFIRILTLYFISILCWVAATSIIWPIFWILCEILYAPFRLVLGLCGLVAFIFSSAYELVGYIWMFVSGIFQFTSNVESTVSSYEVSMWRSLWHDLFSQVGNSKFLSAKYNIMYDFHANVFFCIRFSVLSEAFLMVLWPSSQPATGTV